MAGKTPIEIIKSILFWSAVPFVFPQALYVKKTAPRFSAPPGERSNRISVEPKAKTSVKLLAVGDSIIQGVGADHFNNALVVQMAKRLSFLLKAEVHYHTIGKIGVDTRGIITKLIPEHINAQNEETTHFDLILVSSGINDATSLLTQKTYADNLNTIILALSKRYPGAKIVLAGFPNLSDFPLLPKPLKNVFGVRTIMLSNQAQKICDLYSHVNFVPVTISMAPESFAEDGYHPSNESYTLYGEALADSFHQLAQQHSNANT